MRRALFVMSIHNYAREVSPVIELFAERGVETHVLIGWSGSTGDECEARWRGAGCIVRRAPMDLGYGDPYEPPDPTSVPASRLWRKLYAVLLLVRFARRVARIRSYGRQLLDDVRPDVVVGGPFRSVGEIDDGIARAVRERRLPFYCVTASPYLGAKNAVDARFQWFGDGMLAPNVRTDHSAVNRLLARRFPQWTAERDGVPRIFSSHPLKMLVTRLFGMLPANPWQQPSEQYDLCFVESEFSRRILLDSGYDSAKIVVAGKALLDQVYTRLGDDAFRACLRAELGLSEGDRFVLFNMEPAWEHGYLTAEEHWTRTHATLRALQDLGAAVVVSLHPLCDPRNYRFVEDKFGYVIDEDHTIGEVYPYCDVSVSFPCSTNLLAALFHRPLVVYDYVGLTLLDSPRAELYRIEGATYAYDPEELRGRVRAALAQAPAGTLSANGAGGASDLIFTTVAVDAAQRPR